MLRVARRAVRGQSLSMAAARVIWVSSLKSLVVEAECGGLVEQGAGPFGVLAGERLGERDESHGDE